MPQRACPRGRFATHIAREDRERVEATGRNWMSRRTPVVATSSAVGCALVLAACLAASSALAAPAPGLPRTYSVQRVDSPIPTPGGRIGAGLINMGDANGDGEDDFVTVQTQG